MVVRRLSFFVLIYLFVVSFCEETHNHADAIDLPSEDVFVAVDPNNFKAIYTPPEFRSYYIYTGPRERGPSVKVSFYDDGPSTNTAHRPNTAPPCFVKEENGEHRRCTKEEMILRRDIEEYLLDSQFHYSPAKTFNISAVNMIWVRVTLPRSREDEFPIESFKLLKKGQKINRFPYSSQEINKKDNFAKNYKALQDKFGVEEFNFHPETFVIPEMLPQLKEQATLNPLEKWIAKPVLGGQGRGIILINSTDVVTENFDVTGEYLVQRYLGNPLLINGYKHTLRIYPFITSFNPLRIYLNKYGIAKFATKPFTNELESFNTDNRNMHITNQALNAYQKAYYANSTSSSSGFRWNLDSWREYIREEMKLDDNAVWDSITDIIVKAMISSEGKIRRTVVEQNLPTDCCFQIFGTDVDMDADMHPWLIESNVNPTLSSKLKFERKEKIEMLQNMFNLVKVGNTTADVTSQINSVAENITAYLAACEESPEKKAVTDVLNEDNFYVIQDHEYELQTAGSFSLVFPNPDNYKKYVRFMEDPGNENLLLWNWIELKKTCKINTST